MARQQKKRDNVERHGRKWRVFKRINGQLYRHPFSYEPSDREVAETIEMLEATYGETEGMPGSLADDIRDYLKTIAGRGSHAQYAQILDEWIAALNGRQRRRHTVGRLECEAVLQQFLTTPRPYDYYRGGRPAPNGLGPGSVRKYAAVLRAFYTAMNGPDGANPLRGAAIPQAPKPKPVGRDYAEIARLLEALPLTRHYGGTTYPLFMRQRAAVTAYVGLPPGMVGELTPAHLAKIDGGWLLTPERRKGSGIEPRLVPVGPEGVAALRAFRAAGAFGPFDVSVLNTSVKRAARRLGIDPATVWTYQLRHSFGEQVYRVTGDQATVGRLMLHSPGSKATGRYTMGAHADVDRAAVNAFSASLPPAPKPQPASKPARRRARVVSIDSRRRKAS